MSETKEKTGWFARLKQGLRKTQVNLVGIFTGGVVDEAFLEDLEFQMISADIGVETSALILERLRERIKLKGLKTQDEVKVALKEIIADILRPCEASLNFDEQKPLVIMMCGVNGAGKTTLLSCLIGTAKPQRGKIRRSKNARLAMLPQRPQALFTQDDVLSDLLEVGNEADARAWAEKLELTGLLDRHPFDLSGGELQRAALCKLLLRNAGVLLLDEPTKGLDAYAKAELGEILKKLNADGVSILTVTHDLDFAASFADRCAMMFDGRVISADEPHRFFSGNRYYTTDANRIAGSWFPSAITCEEVVQNCREAGR